MGQAKVFRPKHLAAKLVAVRQALGLSQSQLITKLGCQLTTARVSEYESGTRVPSLLVLLAYAKLARVSVNVLIDDAIDLRFRKNFKAPKQIARQLR